MQTFNHLITTRPHDVRQVLISDLHLSLDEPALVQAFLALLDDCLALPNLKRLFILGDWFEVWLGDDVNKLKQLRIKGCEILVMHGNRDFLLDRGFLNLFGGELIDEPYSLDVGKQSYRLEHGDALCSDDKKYQWFRKVIRHRLSKWYLLNKSLSRRLAIADNIRAKSKLNNRTKDAYIMDVNEQSVAQAVADNDALLHGHTHRPNVHTTINGKTRYVLGDWRHIDTETRLPKVSAVIGAVVSETHSAEAEFSLVEFVYSV
jgi:UDP-2,3-diacylglucosamine hydrolase